MNDIGKPVLQALQGGVVSPLRQAVRDMTWRDASGFVRDKPAGLQYANAQFMGEPDGPLRFIKSLGMEVPTFIDPRDDLKSQYKSASAHVAVDYHVPVKFRGPYKPPQLADYSKDQNYPIKSDSGFVRCGGLKADGQLCQKVAANRTGFCSNHGGALHPADKLFTTERGIMPTNTSTLSRLQKVEMEIIPISELTDEEIVKCRVKEDDGTFSKTSQILSTKINNKMRAEFFARADQFVKENVMDMLAEMRMIALSKISEDKDKIVAIQWLTERALGKTPDVLITNKTDSPFEALYGDVMAGGTREEYRQQRGQTSFIEGEVQPAIQIIEEDEDDSTQEVPEDELPAAADVQLPGEIGDAGDNREPDNGESTVAVFSSETATGYTDAKPVLSPVEIAKAKREAKARIKRARNRRFAARAQGYSTIDNLWYEVAFPTQKALLGTGTHRMKLIAPDDQKPI